MLGFVLGKLPFKSTRQVVCVQLFVGLSMMIELLCSGLRATLVFDSFGKVSHTHRADERTWFPHGSCWDRSQEHLAFSVLGLESFLGLDHSSGK